MLGQPEAGENLRKVKLNITAMFNWAVELILKDIKETKTILSIFMEDFMILELTLKLR